MVLGGAFLSIRTLNRENFRVKIGPDEFPVIFEDGDYENLDRARLIWTVNNLFESVYDFEFAEYGNSRRYHINGREVETNLYLHQLGRGKYTPDILRKIGYKNIVEVDGINHFVLSRQFIEAFIKASSKYAEVTDELNNFIDRLNQVKSVEIDNLTEAQIDSMLLLGPGIADEAGLEDKEARPERIYSRYALSIYQCILDCRRPWDRSSLVWRGCRTRDLWGSDLL